MTAKSFIPAISFERALTIGAALLALGAAYVKFHDHLKEIDQQQASDARDLSRLRDDVDELMWHVRLQPDSLDGSHLFLPHHLRERTTTP